MIAIAALLLIVLLSLLVIRGGAIALKHTGIPPEIARFQARSAFTGAGFTTRESELIVQHPVRRRIAMWLMLVGNVGLVSATATLIASAFTIQESGGWALFGLLTGGSVALCLLETSHAFDRVVCGLLRHVLRRFASTDTTADFQPVAGGYGLLQLCLGEDSVQQARAGNWEDESMHLPGIVRAGERFVSRPRPDTPTGSGDRLVLYGPEPALRMLASRSGADLTGAGETRT